MDECAFPILLVDLAYRNGVLNEAELGGYRDMIRRAAAFVLSHGPATAQDRWEEDGGSSTFTLPVEILGYTREIRPHLMTSSLSHPISNF